MVAEHESIARAACMRSANFDVHAARPQRVERFSPYGRQSQQRGNDDFSDERGRDRQSEESPLLHASLR